MTTGTTIKSRRESLGIDHKQLADMIGVSTRQLFRYESEEQQPTILVAKRIAVALDISLDELAGNLPVGLSLAKTWYCRWITTRDGVEILDSHEAEASFASAYVVFTSTSGDYAWRWDARHLEESLGGGYYSTDRGRRSRGEIYIHLSPHGNSGVGGWQGLYHDGIYGSGRGCISRSAEHADRLIKTWKDHEGPLTEYPKEFL